jgi:hypothetical protein
MTPLLPIPRRCIWCKRSDQEGTFTNESHVLAEAIGNVAQKLPQGIVCDLCNQYYGSKIEPWLLDDPLFHARAVVIGLVDPEDMNAFRSKMFDDQHLPVDKVNRSLHLNARLEGQRLTLDIDYAIRGTTVRDYEPRHLMALSRAAHKIAFESVAYSLFVRGFDKPALDLFDARFDPVRRWARDGAPPRPIRPVARFLGNEANADWSYEVRRYGASLGAVLKLFGDWYGVSLTSTSDQVLKDVWDWSRGAERQDIWIVGDSLFRPT